MSGTDLSTPGPKDPMKRVCTAHRTNGQACRKPPIIGGTVCATHGGSAPQTVAAARRRLLAAAEPLMANLIKIATSSDDEALRLRATMDALTRAGLTERTTVQVEVTHAFDEVLAGIVDDAVATRRGSGLVPALPAGGGAGVEEDEAAQDARDAAELRAVDEMAADAAAEARDQERVAAGSGGETFGPWGGGASPGADGHYTVTRMPGRDDDEALPSYLRDDDERGRADFSR